MHEVGLVLQEVVDALDDVPFTDTVSLSVS